MPIESINPATEETLATFPEMPDSEVDAALAQAQAAFKFLARHAVRGAPRRPCAGGGAAARADRARWPG